MKNHRLLFPSNFLFIIIILLVLSNLINSQSNSEEGDNSVLDGLSIINGPENIKLGQIAAIKIPADYVYLNATDTRTFMERLGNPPSYNEEGLIADEEFNWFVVFEFIDVGYVPDDEKDDLDAEAMLESLIEANEEANKIREKNGWGKLIITGWEIEPRYNQLSNNLEWAIRGRDEIGYLVINHSTRLLGRKGVMELTLVVSPDLYANVSTDYATLIKTFSFQSGQKYAEYTEGDKVAEYGLTALVVGGGTAIAAKSGLLKYLWKIIVGIFIAGAAFFKKIFRKFSKKEVE